MSKTSLFSNKTAWILVEAGLKGTENQCVALAEHLDFKSVVYKYPKLKKLWRFFAPYMRLCIDQAYEDGETLLKPPFPDVIITSGRKAVLAGLCIKRQSKGQSFLINIQDPCISPHHFDAVIAPMHDKVSGENVIKTYGALHRITPDFLNHNKSNHYSDLKKLPNPKIAVLIGGTTTKSKFTVTAAQQMADKLLKLQQNLGASLMITTSRRTGQAQTELLQSVLAHENNFIWDGQGSNPYFDFLKLADFIIATNDSVSMVSEAIATEKPVYLIPIGSQGRRINQFQKTLLETNLVRTFTGDLENWDRPKGDNMLEICAQLQHLYSQFLNSK